MNSSHPLWSLISMEEDVASVFGCRLVLQSLASGDGEHGGFSFLPLFWRRSRLAAGKPASCRCVLHNLHLKIEHFLSFIEFLFRN